MKKKDNDKIKKSVQTSSACGQNHMAAETYKYTCIRRIAKSEDHSQSAPVTVPLGGCMRFLIFVFNAYSMILVETPTTNKQMKTSIRLLL